MACGLLWSTYSTRSGGLWTPACNPEALVHWPASPCCSHDHVYGVYVTHAGRYKRLDLIFVAAPCLPHALLGWTGSTVFLRLLKDHCNRQARADSQGRGYLTTNHNLYDRKSECVTFCVLGEDKCLWLGRCVCSGLAQRWAAVQHRRDVVKASSRSCTVQTLVLMRMVNGIQCCVVCTLKAQAAVCFPCRAWRYEASAHKS